MRALMIDDEDDIREIVEISLGDFGDFDLLTAGDGRTGLAIAVREKPDVILLDVMMPELDGPSTLALLRAAPETASIPVIFMTAKARAAEHRKLLDLGATGVITKPFDPMLLAGQILDLLATPPA